MYAVGIMALLTWGGTLTWRWYHFRMLARYHMGVAERAYEVEQQ
jgi:hypothetical protein